MSEEKKLTIEPIDHVLQMLTPDQINECCKGAIPILLGMGKKTSGEALLTLAHAIALLSGCHIATAVRLQCPNVDAESPESLQARRAHVHEVANAIVNFVMSATSSRVESIQASAN